MLWIGPTTLAFSFGTVMGVMICGISGGINPIFWFGRSVWLWTRGNQIKLQAGVWSEEFRRVDEEWSSGDGNRVEPVMKVSYINSLSPLFG
jgi:hypothetical protein